MVETGGPSVTIAHNNQWVTIIASCDDELSPAADVGTFHAVWRQWNMIDVATVPVGTQYEVEIATTKGGVATVHQVVSRKIRAAITPNHPQGDYLGAFLANLTGNNGYRVRMRLVGTGSGSIDLRFSFASAQGSRATMGSARNAIAGSATIDSTWRIIGTVTVNNTSGGDVDLQLQGSFSIDSGTPGQRIHLGFGKAGQGSSGSHYSWLYVPPVIPEQVTAFDYVPNEGVTGIVPPGTTVIEAWARVDSGTVNISSRRFEVLAMSATPSNDTARMYNINHGPTVHSEDTTAAQPQACIMLDKDGGLACNQSATLPQTYTAPCGQWTKLLEMNMPPNDKWTASVGGGYIEILGKSCASGTTCWDSATWAQVGIEVVTNSPEGSRHAVDFHMTSFSVPTAPTHLYFFEDAFSWGNQVGNTLRLWVRLIDYPCSNDDPSTVRKLTIGRRYLGIRFFERTGDLYY